jgi:arylsulfatase A-like enzyme/Flp pilus assembly protein TadD
MPTPERARPTPFRPAALAALLLLATALPGAGAPGKAAAPAKPNILLITIDTLRADHLGCYGDNAAETPNIDALAGRGVLFTRAFAHTPETLPSHANIMLGLTPNAHGVHDNSNFIVREGFVSLAEWLKGQGYATGAVVGAFPLDSRFGLTQGFDLYDDNYGSQGPWDMTFVERRAEAVVGLGLEWLKGRTGPWFLWLHCFDPHIPYEPPEPYRIRYPKAPYDGEIAYVDSALGKLWGYLKGQGLEDRTAVILTADHGESLGDHGEITHGYFAYNSVLHVPLIVTLPGQKAGRVDADACHVDIFPTICDCLGVKGPAGLQGRSLLPALNGKALPDKPIYFEALAPYYSRGWAPLRGYIRGGEKYMDSPIPEVYDIRKDFGEHDNLASKADLGRFGKGLADLMRQEASPLADSAGQTSDRETREKLRSLGYLSSVQKPALKTFTAREDLKTLLPYHLKLNQATAAYSAGRINEGIRLLKEILADWKTFDLAYTYLAIYYQKQGRPGDAEAVLREGYANNPSNFNIMTALGIALIDKGAFDQAIDVLTRSLSLIDFDPETWNYLGVAYWNKGRYDEALDAYDRALSLDKNFAIVLNNRGALHLSRFLQLKRADELAAARQDFEKAVALDPRYASAYNGLGGALREAGDIDGAIAAWKKAVEIKPDFAFALYNLGLGLLGKDRRAEALDCFTRYKALVYASLPPKERERLDALIRMCR